MYQLWIALSGIEDHNIPAFIPDEYGKTVPEPGYHIYSSPVEPYVPIVVTE